MESSSSPESTDNGVSQQRRLLVHVRPLNSYEINRRSRSILDEDRTTLTRLVLRNDADDDAAEGVLECESVFQEGFTEEEIYSSMVSVHESSTLPQQLLQGFHATWIFYAVESAHSSEEDVMTSRLQQRLIEEVFQNLKDLCTQKRYLQCRIQCSILEILQVDGRLRLRDLIDPRNPATHLQNATTVSCIGASDVWHWMQRASAQRYLRASNTLLVQLHLELYDPSARPDERTMYSHFQMIDVKDALGSGGSVNTTRLLHALDAGARHTTMLSTLSPSVLCGKETMYARQVAQSWRSSPLSAIRRRHVVPSLHSSSSAGPVASLRTIGDDTPTDPNVVAECEQLKTTVSLLQSQCVLLQEKELHWQSELRNVQQELQQLQQRQHHFDYQLRMHHFREHEAVVFLRQVRRFYFRLLQKIALEASGNASGRTKSSSHDQMKILLERVPGAPDSLQLMDLDQRMMESGLLEAHEIGQDIEALELPSNAEQRSKEQLDSLLQQQETMELVDGKSVGDAIPLALDPAFVSNASHRESPDKIEARQKLYQTPAGRSITLREKMLEEELLQMTELNHQLRQCLIKEQVNVAALSEKMGLEQAFDRMRQAQEVQRAKDAVERKNNDLKAVIWKMNELHMVGKTLNMQLQSREKHILYLEEKVISMQHQNETVLINHQLTEQHMQKELQTAQTELSKLTLPIWHLDEAAQADVPMPCRVLVPFHLRDDDDGCMNDDWSVTDIEQWMASGNLTPAKPSDCVEISTQTETKPSESVEISTQTEVKASDTVEVSTQTEDDEDVIAALHMSNRITEETLDDLLFMDSPIQNVFSVKRAIEISSSMIVESKRIDPTYADTLQHGPTLDELQPPLFDCSFHSHTARLSVHERLNEPQLSPIRDRTVVKKSLLECTLPKHMDDTSLNAPITESETMTSCVPMLAKEVVTAVSVERVSIERQGIGDVSNSIPAPEPSTHSSIEEDVRSEKQEESSAISNSYDNPIDVCADIDVTEKTADNVEPLSPLRPSMNKSKSESPSRSRKSPVPKKLSSFLDRLQKQTQRKIDSDEKTTTPEFLKMFNKIGSKNKNETVLETAGAAPARDATRTSFEQLRRGSMSNTAHKIGQEISSASTKKWTPRKLNREDSDSDDSFAKAFMSGAQLGRPSSHQQQSMKSDTIIDERNTRNVDDDSDSDDSFARSFMKGAHIVGKSNIQSSTTMPFSDSTGSNSEVHVSKSNEKFVSDSSESSAESTAKKTTFVTEESPKSSSPDVFRDSENSSNENSIKAPERVITTHNVTQSSIEESLCSDSKPIVSPEYTKKNASLDNNQNDQDSDESSSSDSSTEYRKLASVSSKIAILSPVVSETKQEKCKILERSSRSDSDSDASSDDESNIPPAKLSIQNISDSDSNSDDSSKVDTSTSMPTASRLYSTPFHRQKSDSEDSDDSSKVEKRTSLDACTSNIDKKATSLKTENKSNKIDESDSGDGSDDESIAPKAAVQVNSIDSCQSLQSSFHHISDNSSGSRQQVNDSSSNLPTKKGTYSDSESDSDDSSIGKAQVQTKSLRQVKSQDESSSSDSSSDSQAVPTTKAYRVNMTSPRKKKDESSSDEDDDESKKSKNAASKNHLKEFAQIPRSPNKTRVPLSTIEKTSPGKSITSSESHSTKKPKYIVRDGKLVKCEDDSVGPKESKSPQREKKKIAKDDHSASGLSHTSKTNKHGDDKSIVSGASKAKFTKSQSKKKSSSAYTVEDGKLMKKVKDSSSHKADKPAFSIVNGKLVKTSAGTSSVKAKKKKQAATGSTAL